MMNEQKTVPEDTVEVPHGGTFSRELVELINKHSMEKESATPDFILAEYLKRCLQNFDMCVRRREAWYGRKPRAATLQSGQLHG